MPDTSAAANDWSAIGTGLATLVGGFLIWIGKWHAGKDQAKSPVTPLPETAGVTMTLIDQKTQAEIAKDTERTADACEALLDVVTTFIKDVEEKEEEREKRDLEERAEKAEREVERLRGEMRLSAGAYTTSPRPKDLLRDE